MDKWIVDMDMGNNMDDIIRKIDRVSVSVDVGGSTLASSMGEGLFISNASSQQSLDNNNNKKELTSWIFSEDIPFFSVPLLSTNGPTEKLHAQDCAKLHRLITVFTKLNQNNIQIQPDSIANILIEYAFNLQHHADKFNLPLSSYKSMLSTHFVTPKRPITRFINDLVAKVVEHVPTLLSHYNHSQSDLAHILLVMLTNAHEYNDTLGLFYYGAKMNHSCAPNTFITFTPSLSVHHLSPTLNQRQQLTTDYSLLFSNDFIRAFWSTPQRQEYLQHTKFFQCQCERCLSPDYLRTLPCPKCKECFVVPTPRANANNEYDFVCRACNERIPSDSLPVDAESTLINNMLSLIDQLSFLESNMMPSRELQNHIQMNTRGAIYKSLFDLYFEYLPVLGNRHWSLKYLSFFLCEYLYQDVLSEMVVLNKGKSKKSHLSVNEEMELKLIKCQEWGMDILEYLLWIVNTSGQDKSSNVDLKGWYMVTVMKSLTLLAQYFTVPKNGNAGSTDDLEFVSSKQIRTRLQSYLNDPMNTWLMGNDQFYDTMIDAIWDRGAFFEGLWRDRLLRYYAP